MEAEKNTISDINTSAVLAALSEALLTGTDLDNNKLAASFFSQSNADAEESDYPQVDAFSACHVPDLTQPNLLHREVYWYYRDLFENIIPRALDLQVK